MIVAVHAFIIALRFNRYIVECKCGRALIVLPLGVRFNRYIVECK